MLSSEFGVSGCHQGADSNTWAGAFGWTSSPCAWSAEAIASAARGTAASSAGLSSMRCGVWPGCVPGGAHITSGNGDQAGRGVVALEHAGAAFAQLLHLAVEGAGYPRGQSGERRRYLGHEAVFDRL